MDTSVSVTWNIIYFIKYLQIAQKFSANYLFLFLRLYLKNYNLTCQFYDENGTVMVNDFLYEAHMTHI